MERIIHIGDHHQRKNNNHCLGNKNVISDYHCYIPWNTLLINKYGLSYICLSPAWLPKSIGSINDYDTFNDFFNNHEARSIRQEILNNSYHYCNSNICGDYFPKPNVKHSAPVEHTLAEEFSQKTIVNYMPRNIIFDFDYTCNFECPSCRTHLINENNGPDAIENFKIVEKIKTLIIDNITTEQVNIRWAGGEPFISKAYQELWKYISNSGKLNIRNTIQTNGSYIHKRTELLNNFLPYIDSIRISFDAGTPATYSQLRKNGNWDTLLSNSRLLKELVIKSGSTTKLVSDYVVQDCNYKEMTKYAEIVDSIGFDEIRIGKMWNWDTWPLDEFNKRNVSDSAHPDYKKFLEELKKVKQEFTNIIASYWAF
jgi:sulfatase maturation enzyme AslB (radical SAM superfamily)